MYYRVLFVCICTLNQGYVYTHKRPLYVYKRVIYVYKRNMYVHKNVCKRDLYAYKKRPEYYGDSGAAA